MRRAALIGVALTAALGCDGALDQRLAIIDEPRVLAVIGEPAEARPGALVRYAAVIAGPGGPIAAAPRWSFCVAPKPPTEDNAVAAACLDDAHLAVLGAAAELTAPLPADGCLLFGPETPPGNFRPRDADATGGYYQPIRVDVDELDGRLAFGQSRITCKLAAAPGPVARDYDLRYQGNTNPTFEADVPRRVAPGADVSLTARWPAEAAEPYLAYDPILQVLAPRREALRVSWFATGGHLGDDVSAIAEGDSRTSVATTWHTPDAGSATVWIVVRDSRGGVAAQSFSVELGP